MGVAFDPQKNESNIKKHGISLRRAEEFDFDSAFFDVDDSQDYGEVRYNAIGWLDAHSTLLLSPKTVTQFVRSASAKPRNRSRQPMTKNPHEQPVPDAENPEWTPEKFAKAKRLSELPGVVRRAITSGKRGPQKSPVKTLISLRISSDVLAALRANGKGWQSMVDDALRRQFLK